MQDDGSYLVEVVATVEVSESDALHPGQRGLLGNSDTYRLPRLPWLSISQWATCGQAARRENPTSLPAGVNLSLWPR